MLGSPVIALSATLPKSTRQGLLQAYAEGSGCSAPELLETSYPRITTFSKGTVIEESFPPSKHVCRELEIRWVTDEQWIKALKEKLQNGGCVAVICSTVGRAQAIYDQLKPYFVPNEELGLFHGRFLFTDRERIEKDCLHKFGKKGKRPDKYVLVATQVIEQSLDVDFDLMISDLAPVDLLLQRSGRLHRHTRDHRPADLELPALWIVKPITKPDSKADFQESGYIYDRHVLLRSWLVLRNRESIQLPEETDSLIEAVYDLAADIPDDLEPEYQEDWQTSLADYRAETQNSYRAKANKIKLPPTRVDNSPDQFTRQGEEDDESTIAAVTRLGEPSFTTIFLKRTEQGLCFPTGERQPISLRDRPILPVIRELLANSTRISKKEIVGVLAEKSNPSEWKSALLRNCRYVELDAEDGADLGEWRVSLDPLKGVVFHKNN